MSTSKGSEVGKTQSAGVVVGTFFGFGSQLGHAALAAKHCRELAAIYLSLVETVENNLAQLIRKPLPQPRCAWLRGSQKISNTYGDGKRCGIPTVQTA